MGIRPSLNLIIGVNDLRTEGFRITDPRARRFVEYCDSGYWDELCQMKIEERSTDYLHNRYRHFRGKIDENFYKSLEIISNIECSNRTPNGYKTRTYGDMFCWDPEYGLPNVVGVYLPCWAGNETRYYNDCFLWLMVAAKILPENPAVFVVPEIPWCETPGGRYLWQAVLQGTDYNRFPANSKYLIEHARILPYFGHELTKDFELAYLILQRCGFDLSYEDLKLMIYVTWS